MYMPEAAPDFHAMNMRMCASAGFVPKVVSEVGQVYTLVGLVSSGAGIGSRAGIGPADEVRPRRLQADQRPATNSRDHARL
ncbi:hypothetical protein ACU4HD_44890 (plasmid) [Cupriavidus basilensis]